MLKVFARSPIPGLIVKYCLLGAVLFLNGCNTAPKQTSGEVPGWVLSPMSDTSEYLYGVGEGYDLDSAKRAALKDVAAKLRVSISGTMQSELSVRNDQVSRQVIDRVSAEVQRIDFSRYEFVKVGKTGQGMVTLVQVDRQAFIAETEDKLATLDKEIQQATRDLDSQPPLNRFVNLLVVRDQLLNARSYAQILTGARPVAVRDPRIARYESLITRTDLAGRDLLVEVRARPQDSDLATALTGLITGAGAKVVPTAAARDTILSVESSQRTNFLQGSHMINMQVVLTIQDGKGHMVSSKRHELVGASVTDQKAARLNALRKWSDQMRTAGLPASLGLTQ